ncbi:MAG TPA: zinc ABC transporter substrate-binding protein [Burkholderiales bacterium]|nr:zinc ABC transporter substrate-binding protein [Burkholderiales bacterium]
MKSIAAILLLAASPAAFAAFNIFASTPEWGALAKELGGEKANVYVASTALQDPHRIEARPSLIARARSADLMVCTGAQLEIGWLPLVQQQSGNTKIQPGQPGYFEAASAVSLIEKPSSVDRSQGDVHPDGNPHIHLDPRNVALVAAALGERMASLDPADAALFRSRTKAFLDRWKEAEARWQQEGAPLKGVGVVVYHKNLSYLLNWLGMRELGALEPKPGLPPSTAHLNGLLEQLKRTPAKAVVRAAYNEPRAAEWLAERTKILSITVPYTVGGTAAAKDLFSLYDDTLARLLTITK